MCIFLQTRWVALDLQGQSLNDRFNLRFASSWSNDPLSHVLVAGIFFVKHHLHDVIVAHRIRAASCVFIWQRGHKAFIDLEYAKFDPNLHTQLFAKHLGQV